MKKLLTLLALVAAPAFGQAYNHPNWLDGSVPARVWTTSPTAPAVTATLPADAYEPAEFSETIAETGWVEAVSGSSGYLQGPTHERKFRIVCEPSTAKQIDPILFKGIPGPIGHRHQGNGSVNWDQNSSYTNLRASPSSTCSGGPLNATNYWEPELLVKTSKGIELGIRPQSQIFYYINGLQSETQNHTWLRRDFGFIGGSNPADYNDTARRAEYAAAGLEYPGGPLVPAGFAGFLCTAYVGGPELTVTRVASRIDSSSTLRARHLKAEDGSDPWGGQCVGTKASPGVLSMQLVAPDCWDGSNLRAPDGRGHVAYSARTGNNAFRGLCPDGWVKVSQLTIQTRWEFEGTEYLNWYFGSDRMNPANTPGDPSSLDPCRKIGPYFCNGATGHFDYIFGWRSNIADEWQRECLGIPVRGVAPTNGPAECDGSRISINRNLKYGGTSPNPALSGGCVIMGSCSDARPGKKARYNPLAAGTKAPTIVHGH